MKRNKTIIIAEAGVYYIKFQTIKIEKPVNKSALKAYYQLKIFLDEVIN